MGRERRRVWLVIIERPALGGVNILRQVGVALCLPAVSVFYLARLWKGQNLVRACVGSKKMIDHLQHRVSSRCSLQCFTAPQLYLHMIVLQLKAFAPRWGLCLCDFISRMLCLALSTDKLLNCPSSSLH